jgi:serine phosphatase RsbU (regulator of sigma subunit)
MTALLMASVKASLQRSSRWIPSRCRPAAGDLLAAFTDGITESENAHEEQFGEGRLIDLLLESPGETSR